MIIIHEPHIILKTDNNADLEKDKNRNNGSKTSVTDSGQVIKNIFRQIDGMLSKSWECLDIYQKHSNPYLDKS